MNASSSVEIVASEAGRIAVRGALTFETARRAHQAGLHSIEAAPATAIEVDCAEITESDSAGLAVLIDWLANARRRDIDLHFANVPDTLHAVARISEIEVLLGIGS